MNIAKVRMESSVLFMPTDITVLMPDNLPETTAPRKVVWLLHGAGGDCRTYLYGADMESVLRKHPALVVMPSAINSDYGNYEHFGRGYDFPSFFFEELMPFVQSCFGGSCAPADNFIVGASMGGYGAACLGLQHPERFGAVGILGASLRESAFLEPYRSLDGRAFRTLAMRDRTRFPTEYGSPEEGIKPKEINVIAKYPTVQDFLDSADCMWNRFPEAARAGKLPRFYVACGTKDLFYKPCLRFQELSERLGVQDHVFFKFEEGVGHDPAFFDAEVGCFMDYCKV